jgi:hypothetical protein
MQTLNTNMFSDELCTVYILMLHMMSMITLILCLLLLPDPSSRTRPWGLISL